MWLWHNSTTLEVNLAVSATASESFKNFDNRFRPLPTAIHSKMVSLAMGNRDMGNDSDKATAKWNGL